MTVLDDAISKAVAPISAGLTKLGPTWADIRKHIAQVAIAKGEWGGAPVPMEHARLIMEARYPFPNVNGFKLNDDKPATIDPGLEVLNAWFDYRRTGMIHVVRENGKSRHVFVPHGSGCRLRYWFDTLGVAAHHAWDISVEERALTKLREITTDQAYKCYSLAGCFLETSKRSGVSYMFRKLRPTIALRPNRDGMMGVIAVLCLHPLGYYDGTWAGVMCPTDDVIAHLLLMRGNEHGLWKKANHHEMYMAGAGI